MCFVARCPISWYMYRTLPAPNSVHIGRAPAVHHTQEPRPSLSQLARGPMRYRTVRSYPSRADEQTRSVRSRLMSQRPYLTYVCSARTSTPSDVARFAAKLSADITGTSTPSEVLGTRSCKEDTEVASNHGTGTIRSPRMGASLSPHALSTSFWEENDITNGEFQQFFDA